MLEDWHHLSEDQLAEKQRLACEAILGLGFMAVAETKP
jgi:hypothetical protein